MKGEELREKSIGFAKRIVGAYRFLCEDKKEFILSKQLLRSGTSIGANIAEAQYGSSRKDFVNKLYIALKECAETLCWLRLLHECEYIYLFFNTSLFTMTVKNSERYSRLLQKRLVINYLNRMKKVESNS